MGQLFRMLVVLQQRGYVAYEPITERYELTLKLFTLSHNLAPVRRLNLVAAPLMKQLADHIGQSCHLVIHYSGKGHVVLQQDSPSERVIAVRLGAVAQLATTCSGHVLLAFADEETRAEMISRIPGEHPTIKKTTLTKLVKKIRALGYERKSSAQIPGVQDIGYPVFDHTGQITAALMVPFVEFLDGSHPLDIETSQKTIAEVARSISKRLGQSEPQPLVRSPGASVTRR
jgi:DNA-binding IclR family transcriptional regulator